MPNSEFNNTFISSPFVQEQMRWRAQRLCRRPEFRLCDPDDVQQDMYGYLLSNRDKFDPSRGTPEAFAILLLSTFYAAAIRRHNRLKRSHCFRVLSLDEPLPDADGQTVTLADILPAGALRAHLGVEPSDASIDPEAKDLIEFAAMRLNDEQWVLFVIAGVADLKTAAEHLGLAYTTAVRRFDEVRAILRAATS